MSMGIKCNMSRGKSCYVVHLVRSVFSLLSHIWCWLLGKGWYLLKKSQLFIITTVVEVLIYIIGSLSNQACLVNVCIMLKHLCFLFGPFVILFLKDTYANKTYSYQKVIVFVSTENMRGGILMVDKNDNISSYFLL